MNDKIPKNVNVFGVILEETRTIYVKNNFKFDE